VELYVPRKWYVPTANLYSYDCGVADPPECSFERPSRGAVFPPFEIRSFTSPFLSLSLTSSHFHPAARGPTS
jgi:hypothetical protein